MRIALHGPLDQVATYARASRDDGHEVVLVGALETAEALAAVAVQEDVDVVALAGTGGGPGADAVRAALDALGAEDVAVLDLSTDPLKPPRGA
ncbi:methylmalonyl-CoA mutase cobalamin-binding domain/chain [Mumia flava]|uniref:Methylmalonyl-CoA mutase cobalamin-binding domain/chain n=1 Tax=Mumia flava TaxID=1348852 RepID=A0A0B2B6V4_9ACTN|nr:hypothetical protein [Mumia flava]PJJ58435.1 methylmalonyl-CoA mutase cobalamin-binding domain/chain [Mumia flava]